MRLIDDEGNFFGKINLIDLLVILILFVVFFATVKLFYSYGITDVSASNSINDTKIVTVEPAKKVRVYLETNVLSDEYIRHIQEGDKDLWEGMNAVIERIEVAKSANNEGDSKELKLVLLINNPKIIDQYYYYSGARPIKVGKEIELKLKFVDFNAKITDVAVVE